MFLLYTGQDVLNRSMHCGNSVSTLLMRCRGSEGDELVCWSVLITLTSVGALVVVELVLGLVTLATEGALEGPVAGVGDPPVFVKVRHAQVCLATVDAHVWSDSCE